MKLIFSLILFLTCSAKAFDEKTQIIDNNITAELGYKQAGVHFGATYVKGHDPIRMGGYVFFQTEDKSNNVVRSNQLLSFGALSKFFLLDIPKGAAYIAPGFGFNEIRNFYDAAAGNPNNFDKFFFGAIFKIGGQYSLTQRTKMGLEYMKIAGWCSEEITDFVTEYSSLTLSFEF